MRIFRFSISRGGRIGTEHGRAGHAANRHGFDNLMWKLVSPKWDFDDATFNRTAESFDNPGHVGIVIHNYRRLSLAEAATMRRSGKRLAEGPVNRCAHDHPGW